MAAAVGVGAARAARRLERGLTMTEAAVPDPARVRHARALLGRVGLGAARRAARDRRLERGARHRAALRCARLDPVDALHRRARRRPVRQPRGRGLRRDLRRRDDAAGPCRLAPAARARTARRGRRVGRARRRHQRERRAIEAESGKRIMPLAHGLYSVGILVGAVGAGLARGAGAHREPILLGVAVLIAITALLLGTERIEPAPSEGRHTIRIERALLGLGILCAAAFVVEGGIESWSALYLERELDALSGRQRSRPGRLRRVDGDRALLRAGRRSSESGHCWSAAGCSRPPAASWRRSRRARRSRSSGSHSAVPASRCTRRSSSAPADDAARARSPR